MYLCKKKQCKKVEETLSMSMSIALSKKLPFKMKILKKNVEWNNTQYIVTNFMSKINATDLKKKIGLILKQNFRFKQTCFNSTLRYQSTN